MYNKLLDEKIIIDLENLVQKAQDFDDEINSYAEFMKEQILNVSGIN